MYLFCRIVKIVSGLCVCGMMLEKWTIFRNYTHLFTIFCKFSGSFNYSAFRCDEKGMGLSGNFHPKFILYDKITVLFCLFNNYFPLLFNQLTKTIISNTYLTKKIISLHYVVEFSSAHFLIIVFQLLFGVREKASYLIEFCLASFLFWLNLLKFFVL